MDRGRVRTTVNWSAQHRQQVGVVVGPKTEVRVDHKAPPAGLPAGENQGCQRRERAPPNAKEWRREQQPSRRPGEGIVSQRLSQSADNRFECEVSVRDVDGDQPRRSQQNAVGFNRFPGDEMHRDRVGGECIKDDQVVRARFELLGRQSPVVGDDADGSEGIRHVRE